MSTPADSRTNPEITPGGKWDPKAAGIDPDGKAKIPFSERDSKNWWEHPVAKALGGLAAISVAAGIGAGVATRGSNDNDPSESEPSVSAPVVPGIEQPTNIETENTQVEASPEQVEEIVLTPEEEIRQKRLEMTDEEIADDPEVWVYPDIPTGTDSFKVEVYGGTLEKDLQVKTNGRFTDYPEGGALTISGKFINLLDYDLKLPYEVNIYDLNNVDSMPADLKPYYQRVHDTLMENLFSKEERNGELATYLDTWGEENLDARFGTSKADAQNADRELDFHIPSVESLQDLKLNEQSNQRFTYEGVEFSKSSGVDQGTTAFNVTIDMFPDKNAPGEYVWKVVDSEKVKP